MVLNETKALGVLSAVLGPYVFDAGTMAGIHLTAIAGFSGTIALQVRHVGGLSGHWRTLKTWTALMTEAETFDPISESLEYQLIVTAYTSGSLMALIFGESNKLTPAIN